MLKHTHTHAYTYSQPCSLTLNYTEHILFFFPSLSSFHLLIQNIPISVFIGFVQVSKYILSSDWPARI